MWKAGWSLSLDATFSLYSKPNTTVRHPIFMTRGSFQKKLGDIDYDEQVFGVGIVKSVRHPILYDSWVVSKRN